LWSYSKIKNDQRKQREDENKAFGNTGLFTGDAKVDQSSVEAIKEQLGSQAVVTASGRGHGEVDEEDEN